MFCFTFPQNVSILKYLYVSQSYIDGLDVVLCTHQYVLLIAVVWMKVPKGDWVCPVCRKREAHLAREAKAKVKREEKRKELEASRANKAPARTVSLYCSKGVSLLLLSFVFVSLIFESSLSSG